MFLLLAMSLGAPPEFTVENKCVEVPKFTVVNKTTPKVTEERAFPQKSTAGVEFTTSSGTVIVLGVDGVYRYKDQPPVSLRQPSSAGGCGCTPSRNCGANFCKSRGGTGCPASCPVK